MTLAEITGGSPYGASTITGGDGSGDYALFFRKASVEITFENERYLVVPQAAILALVRDTNVADDVVF